MAQLFISYRRDDSLQFVGRLYDRLVLEFGEGAVFMDIEEMLLGIDFRPQLIERLQDCKAVIAVIGPRWLTEEGGPSKYVTMELETALAQEGLPVIPLLLDGTGIPDIAVLPDSLKELPHRSGLTIYTNKTFSNQIQELVGKLTKLGLTPVEKAEVARVRRSNLQFNQNAYFTGREDELQQIANDAAGNRATVCVHVVTGLGGVGKSQIVQEYARRNREQYDLVWWIQAETSQGLVQSLASLASELGLPQSESHHIEEMVAASIRWLCQHKSWLLIYDNANSLDEIRRYLPSSPHGHVLVTSRNPNWHGAASLVITLQAFNRDDSAEFLTNSSGDSSREDALELAEKLGDLPLALEQARAYITNRGITIANYLEFLDKHGKQLLAMEESPNYPRSVATTFAIAMDELSSDNPTAALLASCLSLLAPEPVPAKLFAETDMPAPPDTEHILFQLDDATFQLPIILDSFLLAEAQASLRKYAIAQVSDNQLSMHRMVQSVIRESLSEDQHRSLIEQLICCIERGFRFLTLDDEEHLNHLLHTEVVLQAAEQLGVQGKPLASLANIYGHCLIIQGQFKKGAQYSSWAATLAEKEFGAESPEHLYTLCDVADATSVEDQAAGREILGQVLAGAEVLKQSNPRVAVEVLKVRCRCLQEVVGPGQESIQAAEDALEEARNIFEAGRLELVEFLQLAAQAYHRSRDLQPARMYHEEAIAICEAQKGKDDLSVLSNLGCYGQLLSDMGENDSALDVLERSVTISSEQIGERATTTADYLTRLGFARLRIDQVDEAADAFVEAIMILDTASQKIHPLLTDAYYGYSLVFNRRGELKQCRDQLELALNNHEEVFGENSMHSIWLVAELIQCDIRLGDLSAADNSLPQMGSMLEKCAGHDHTYWASRLSFLRAQRESLAGNWQEAFALCKAHFTQIAELDLDSLENHFEHYFYIALIEYGEFVLDLLSDRNTLGIEPLLVKNMISEVGWDIGAYLEQDHDLVLRLNNLKDELFAEGNLH